MLKKFMTRKNTKASKRKEFLSGLRFETLERRELLAGDLGAAYAEVAEGEGGEAHQVLYGEVSLVSNVSLGGDGYVAQPVLGQAPRDVAISYLQDNAAEFGGTAGDFSEYRVVTEYLSQHTRVTHVVLQQQFNGLDIENSFATIAVDNDGRILSAGTNFVKGLGDTQVSEESLAFSPAVSAIDAYQAVVSAVGGTLTSNPVVTDMGGGDSHPQVLTGGGASTGDVNVELVLSPTASDAVELVWLVQYHPSDGVGSFRGLVGADDGGVKHVINSVYDASYTVYPLPGGGIGDTSSQTLSGVEVVNPSASPFGWHDTNGIEGAEFTDTRGNNVFAQGGDDTPYDPLGYRPDGGTELDFNTPYDELSHATMQGNVEVQALQAFYIVNLLHDVTHNYGFDEAAGNFQATNYTGLGLGGDQLIVNVADPGTPAGAALCNAYYMPGMEGTSGTIEMGFCGNAAPSRGSALDTDVMIHEWGHALHTRLQGGPYNEGGINGVTQTRAMGEGIADYLALWFQMDVNDTPDQENYIGEYYNNDPGGIRTQPYSYDLAVNPNTFDVVNITDMAETYRAGEVWASLLHDLTWELLFKYGGSEDAGAMATAFNEDISQSVGRMPGNLTGDTPPISTLTPGLPITTSLGMDALDYTTGANNLAFQLLIDSMKLVPFAATFDQGRDAILAADVALTGGVNHDVIWKAFARRGLGFGSFAGDDIFTPTVQTSYGLPPTPADIAGNVFIDGDANGVRDIGESPISGVTLFLDLNDNGTHERLEPWTTSDSNGDYNFVMYTGGQFNVKAIQQDDMQQTLPDTTQIPGGPINTGGHDVYVVTGHSTPNVDFGFSPNEGQLGINGTKFNDVNGNGVMDPGEVGVAGVFIYIDQDMDGRIDIGEPATRTGEDGSYYIEFNEGGTYHIREVVEPGWTQISPAAGYHEVVVIPGLANYDVDFANGETNDYGDLPVSFDGTNPAAHGIVDGLHLGTAVDADPGPNNGVQANGDDFDDGVVFIDNLVRGMNDVTMEVTASIGDNSSALLNAWIDFDGDGAFDSASEQIVTNLRLTEGVNSIDIEIPVDAQLGATYARFRYGYENNLGPNGDSIGGEVEDYLLDASFSGGIIDDRPVAIDDTFTYDPNITPIDDKVYVLANDFGSSNGNPILIEPGSGQITTVQGGTVLVFPDDKYVKYFPPSNDFSGSDSFEYEITDGAGQSDTGSVSVNVLPLLTDAIAVDDFFRVPDNAQIGQPQFIDVLDNDIVGSNAPLMIVTPSLSADGHISVTLAGNTLSYTFDDDDWDLDSFEYTIVDSMGNQETATVTIECTPPEDTVEYIVEAFTTLGAPLAISSDLSQGDVFDVRVSVKDSRPLSDVDPAEAGVYAAYVDLLFDKDYLRVVPDTLDYGSIFDQITSGPGDTPGLIDEAGGVQTGLIPDFDRGTQAMESFTVQFEVLQEIDVDLIFQTDPVNVSPLHDTVVIAPAPSAVDRLDIRYGSATISGEGEGEALLDTNGDGSISPLDALGIINQLNEFGSGAVAEGESRGLDRAFDVNRDSYVSPLDALAIINYLNENSGDVGEGEAIEIVPQATIDTNVAGNEINAIDAVTAEVVDEYLRVRENEIGLAHFTGGSLEVVEEDTSDLESAIDDLADDVFGQWN